MLPSRFSTPGIESKLRFFEQRYSNGTPRQKAICDLPVHGFACAMAQARFHGANRNRSVEPYDPWQRRLLGLEVASLQEPGEPGEIQTASIGFFLTLASRAPGLQRLRALESSGSVPEETARWIRFYLSSKGG